VLVDAREQAPVAEARQPGISRLIWHRTSNIGVFVILILALAYSLKDVVPRALIDRFVGLSQDNESEPMDWASEHLFSVSFSPGSDVLESDTWYALDGAVLKLAEQPERIALISDISRDPQSTSKNPALSGARFAAVERYLVAAGVDRNRFRAKGRDIPGNSVESVPSGLETAEKMNRIVRINIDSKYSP
jgi:outer membrane protein OmpA-like peptidoglycan-associated protein